MTRAIIVRRTVAVALFALAFLFGLYGLFALVYNDEGGATSVMIAGRRFDAHLVGALSLVVGGLVALMGMLLGRRRLP